MRHKTSLLISITLRFLASALWILLFPIIAHIFGNSSSSQIAAFHSIATIFAVICMLGTEQFISQKSASAEEEYSVVSRVSLICIVVFLIMLILNSLTSFGYTLVLVASLFQALNKVIAASLIGFGCAVEAIIYNSLLLPFFFLSAVCIVLSTNTSLLESRDVVEILSYLYVGSSIVSFIVSACLYTFGFKYKYRRVSKAVPIKLPTSPVYYSIVTVQRAINSNLLILLVARLSEESAWIIAVIQRMLNFFPAIQVAFNAVTLRKIIRNPDETSTYVYKPWFYTYVLWLSTIGLVLITSYAIFDQILIPFDNWAVVLSTIVIAGYFQALVLRESNVVVRMLASGLARTYCLLLIFPLAAQILYFTVIAAFNPMPEAIAGFFLLILAGLSNYLVANRSKSYIE